MVLNETNCDFNSAFWWACGPVGHFCNTFISKLCGLWSAVGTLLVNFELSVRFMVRKFFRPDDLWVDDTIYLL